MKVFSFDPRKNKEVFVGTFDSFNNTLTLPKTSRHFMLKYNGYGLQADIWARVIQRKCNVVIKKGKKQYFSTYDEWWNKSQRDSFGHGVQYFLSIEHMTLR